MSYVLKREAKAWEPIPGVPWRDLTDEEYRAASAAYDKQFSPDQAGSLARFFDHVEAKPSPKRTAKEV